MKKTLIALAVLTLAVVALSFGVARWSICHSVAETASSMHDTAWLKRELKLTDTQTAEIEKLDKEFRAKIEGCCENHCGARFALSEELAKPQVDLPKATACVEKMCAAQADSEKATFQHILGVREVLNPDQQKRYAELINRQLCTACPMGMHKPG